MRNQIDRSLQYLYFLRFSLFLWLFPLLFAALDSGCLGFSTRTLTRGIFVPEWWSGYACVAFYLISKAFVALLCARIIVINGVDRFSAQRPEWLSRLLADPDAQGEGKAIVISLLPALATFAYLLV